MAKEKINGKDAADVFKKVAENLKNGVDTEVEVDKTVIDSIKKNMNNEDLKSKPSFVFSILIALAIPLIMFLGTILYSGVDIYKTASTGAPFYVVMSKACQVIFSDIYVGVTLILYGFIFVVVIIFIAAIINTISRFIRFRKTFKMAKEIAKKTAPNNTTTVETPKN